MLHEKKLILVCFSNLKFARQGETPYDANFKFGTLGLYRVARRQAARYRVAARMSDASYRL